MSAENSRLDKWLSFSCILKTRSQATKACESSRIRVNGEVAKPSKIVRIGDTIEVRYKSHQRKFDIVEIANRNLPHAEARKLYREHELTADEKKALEMRQLLFQAAGKFKPKYKGRPTKKERRKLEQFKEDSFNESLD